MIIFSPGKNTAKLEEKVEGASDVRQATTTVTTTPIEKNVTATPKVHTTQKPISTSIGVNPESNSPYFLLNSLASWSSPVSAEISWRDCENQGSLVLASASFATNSDKSSFSDNISQKLVNSGWIADACNTGFFDSIYHAAYSKNGKKLTVISQSDSNIAEISASKVIYTVVYEI